MITTDADPCLIARHVVDSVWNGFVNRVLREVVCQCMLRRVARLPLSAVALQAFLNLTPAVPNRLSREASSLRDERTPTVPNRFGLGSRPQSTRTFVEQRCDHCVLRHDCCLYVDVAMHEDL